MNLDKKLELAHEYAIVMIMAKIGKDSAEKFAITAFDLADAMEVEYNKRKQQQTVEDISQDVGLFLNSTDSSQLEWQPDWSVAPENTEEWSVERGGVDARWTCYGGGDKYHMPAPLFNYRGDWKDSLRKRPNRKPVPPTVETPPIKIIGGG